jgi:murein DD-endopeptidase MepM/ murein hydrolase activator NlpD
MRRLLAILACLIICGIAVYTLRPQPGPPIVYKVERGDTLFLIGKAHGVSVEDLKTWNALDSDLIEVGLELGIWPASPASAPASSPSRSAPRRRAKKAAAASLSMPKPKRCLSGPTLDAAIAEDGFSGSEGLSPAAIKSALSDFLPQITSCLISGPAVPQNELLLDFRVGCNGQVQSIEVSSAGDWNSAQTDCVTATLRYTPFPAHALPDGETFLYPIRLSQ